MKYIVLLTNHRGLVESELIYAESDRQAIKTAKKCLTEKRRTFKERYPNYSVKKDYFILWSISNLTENREIFNRREELTKRLKVN